MQSELFADDEVVSISELPYQPDFLSRQDEAQLLEVIRTLPLRPAKYRSSMSASNCLTTG